MIKFQLISINMLDTIKFQILIEPFLWWVELTIKMLN